MPVLTFVVRPMCWKALLGVHLVIIASVNVCADDPPRLPLQALEEQIQDVIDSTSPSVVAVIVSHAKYPGANKPNPNLGKLGEYVPQVKFFNPILGPENDPLDLSKPANAANHQFGTGLVLEADKILTPYHLIEGATKVYIRASNGSGSYANILAADAKCDLAVLEPIDPLTGTHPAKLGEVRLSPTPDGKKVNVRRGTWVLALGQTVGAGLEDGQPSASWGIISSIRRRANFSVKSEQLLTKEPLSTFASLLQTDARIALGSTGAVVVNLSGEVIGIGSALANITGSEVSGGYVMPFDNNTKRMIDVLKAGREVEYGFLGIVPNDHPGGGVVIRQVSPGCPAAISQLRAGDVIRRIDGNPLKDRDDLLLYVGGALAGTTVNAEVQRGSRVFSVEVQLAKIANPLPSIVTMPPPNFAGLSVEYSSIRLSQLAAANLPNLVSPPEGVWIREIKPKSRAEKKLSDAGNEIRDWFITQIDNKPIRTPIEFEQAIQGKDSITITLVNPEKPNIKTNIVLP